MNHKKQKHGRSTSIEHMPLTNRWFVLLWLFLLLLFSFVIAVACGSSDLSIGLSWKILISKIPILKNSIDLSQMNHTYEIIVWKVRMPRIVLSALVGGSLAIVGVTFQGIFQNPLADPHILGVSSGAALGATLALLLQMNLGLSLDLLGLGTLGIFSFCGAILTVFLVYSFAKLGGEISTVSMLLTGTAISTLCSAMISLLMTFHHEQIEKVYMWTMGSFSAANWDKVKFLSFFVIVCVVILLMYSQKLNVMMMGEEDAKTLGIDTTKLRKKLVVVASLLVAAAVSVSGIIGFVGLIIPHCVRLLSGADNKRVMPESFLVGAIFLMLCDTLARTVAAPTEIPVGIITALCGAPFFIWLLWKRR